MTVKSSRSCSYGSPSSQIRFLSHRLLDFRHVGFYVLIKGAIGFTDEWTPFLLVASYFVFSVCLYCFCTQSLIEFFWFAYLTTNFYIAGSTVIEAWMGLAPVRDARKAAHKLEESGWKFPTPDAEIPVLDLIIVSKP